MLYKHLTTDWNKWINEEVYIGITDHVPRHVAVHRMCADGIFPFMKKAGYELYSSEQRVTKDILYCMYQYYKGSRPTIPNRQHVLLELFEQFHHIFDSDALLDFWDVWGSVEDFDTDGYSYRFRGELPFLVWNYINFDSSPVTADILDDPEAAEMMKTPNDEALQDVLRDSTVKDRHLY